VVLLQVGGKRERKENVYLFQIKKEKKKRSEGEKKLTLFPTSSLLLSLSY